MSINKLWSYKIVSKDLVYRYIDENNSLVEATEPLMVNGERNPKIDVIVDGVKATMNEIAELKRKKAVADVMDTPKIEKTISKPVIIPDDAEVMVENEDEETLEDTADRLFKTESIKAAFIEMQNSKIDLDTMPFETADEHESAYNDYKKKEAIFNTELVENATRSERRKYRKFADAEINRNYAKDTLANEEVDLDGEEIAEEQEKQEATISDVEPTKKKKWLKTAGKTAIVALLVIAIALGVKSCVSNQNSKTETAVAPATTTTSSVSINDLKEDSRYTNITEDMLVSTTEDFVKELSNHGITVTASDALTYVTLANITHIQETNPEILAKVLDGMDSVETLSKTGHIIGQIVTNEVTTKDDTVDWTVAFIDETDRKIAAHGAVYVVEGAKEIAADETLKEDEKIAQIQALVENKFVAPNFDKTVGYTYNDGSKITLSQEEGADFISDAIITGILMGDNTLKNYINAENTYKDNKDTTWVTTTSAGEVSADLKAISENTDNVANLMRMIEGCQSLDSNAASISDNENNKSK